jgi:hypothetical protein
MVAQGGGKKLNVNTLACVYQRGARFCLAVSPGGESYRWSWDYLSGGHKRIGGYRGGK